MEADGFCQLQAPDWHAGTDVWCYAPDKVLMGGESMDHLMFWLRHYKKNGNWMWLGMCKGCGKQFQGTGLA